MTRHRTPKVSLFGNFGVANLGNDATLLVVVSRLRLLFPDGELCCICTAPENVAATHELEAVPHTRRGVRIWDRSLRLGERLRTASAGLSEEVHEYARAWRVLKDTNLFIVPGTGLLTDAWGLAGWGPYGLFKWSLVAKLRGCRVMFVSVGAGPIQSALGRRLVKWALSFASYRSYRDLESKRVVGDLGIDTREDPVYPDLVFDLSRPANSTHSAPTRDRAVVGVGLMEYAWRYSASSPTDDTYGHYIASLAAFVRWLLDRDHDVRLILGDSDSAAIDDLRVLLPHEGSTDARVSFHPAESVDDLLFQLDTTDVVVATRFHNVLFSLLLGKPVVALSFHHKCSALMEQMRLSEYCHDIHDMSTERLIAQFEAAVGDAEDLSRTITERVEVFRQALTEQYGRIFEHLGERV